MWNNELGTPTPVTFIGEEEYVASSQTRAGVPPLRSENEKEPSVHIFRAESVGEKHELENILLGKSESWFDGKGLLQFLGEVRGGNLFQERKMSARVV